MQLTAMKYRRAASLALATLPVLLIAAAPFSAFAQTAGCTDAFCTSGFGKLGIEVVDFINQVLVPLIFAVSFIVFLYGIFQGFILNAANEEKRKEGQKAALWGIIGFAVMISVWGLVTLVIQTLDVGGTSGPPAYPTL